MVNPFLYCAVSPDVKRIWFSLPRSKTKLAVPVHVIRIYKVAQPAIFPRGRPWPIGFFLFLLRRDHEFIYLVFVSLSDWSFHEPKWSVCVYLDLLISSIPQSELL